MENKKTNKKAMTSFILSLIGIFIFRIVLGIIALVKGNCALREFNPETETGDGFAQAGRIIGAIDIVLGVISVLVFCSIMLVGALEGY